MGGGAHPNKRRVAAKSSRVEGAVRRGRRGKEKEWTDCIQSDIAEDESKATVLEAEVWVDMVTEGGRR